MTSFSIINYCLPPLSFAIKFFFSLTTFSYLLNSLFALSCTKSHSTSKLYLYLIGFFSKSSAITVILHLNSSKWASFSTIYPYASYTCILEHAICSSISSILLTISLLSAINSSLPLLIFYALPSHSLSIYISYF